MERQMRALPEGFRATPPEAREKKFYAALLELTVLIESIAASRCKAIPLTSRRSSWNGHSSWSNPTACSAA